MELKLETKGSRMKFKEETGHDNRCEGLYRLADPLTGSNCYVIQQGDSCLILDPNSFELLELLFQKRNIYPVLVCLTHEHCDHIGGLNALRQKYDVTVAASRSCSFGIQDSRKNMSRRMEALLYYKSGRKYITSYEPFVCKAADLQFSDEIEIPFREGMVWMKVLPGHSCGSTVICYKGLLFSGDYLLPERKVITRMPGGSEEEYQKLALPWLRGILDGTKIYPGHGDPFFMNEEVRAYHEL